MTLGCESAVTCDRVGEGESPRLSADSSSRVRRGAHGKVAQGQGARANGVRPRVLEWKFKLLNSKFQLSEEEEVLHRCPFLHHLENQKLHNWCKTHFLVMYNFYIASCGSTIIHCLLKMLLSLASYTVTYYALHQSTLTIFYKHQNKNAIFLLATTWFKHIVPQIITKVGLSDDKIWEGLHSSKG
jgi:hypothetical protein